MLRRLAVLMFALVLVPPVVQADDDEAFVKEHLDGLSGKAALEHVTFLADDKMKGRKTGFEGGKLVENWMLEKMSEFGLHPADAGGTYLEPFTYGAANTKAPIALTVGGTKLTYGKDYFDLTYTGSGKVDAEAVFVGYGIERPDVGWDDYAGMDVKGKVVVAIRGAPAAMSTTFSEERYIGYKSSKAAEKGAAGFLLVQNAGASTGTIQDRFHRAKLPALWVSGAVANTLFAGKKTTLAELKKSRDEGTPGKGFATGVKVQMEVNATYDANAKGHNALGAIKGRDPDLVHEIILVGAHMDHLGVGPDGQVFNGADDNASGTAVMIHLADVLTANRLRPKRTIIFCGFGAEEQGLFGSRALAERYPFQGEIVAVLNMDMVGQGEPVVRVNGGGFFPKVQEVLASAIPASQAKQVEFGPYAGGGSDHWPFLERGVPAFAISTKGKHPNYHTPLDDAGAIKAECLEATANVVGRMLLKLAMHPESLRDEKAVANFLVREGPRYAMGHTRPKPDGTWIHMLVDPTASAGLEVKPELAELADGLALHGAVWFVAPGPDGDKAWAEIVAMTEGDDAQSAIVRTPAEMMRTWRAKRFGFLPLGTCLGPVEGRVAQIQAFAKQGFPFVSPWTGLADDQKTPETIKALAAACLEAKVVPDMGVLKPEQWAVARKCLGDAPALAFLDSGARARFAKELPGVGAQTLVIDWGSPGESLAPALADGAPPTVLFDLFGLRGMEVLHGWGAKQPEGWALPGSPQRKAVRAVLGGNLLAWLAKAERLRKE